MILKSSFLSINESCSILYATKSSIETILISNFFATFKSSGKRAIVPSSFIISTITPAGSKPAKRAKSMAASVCPVLLKTPPSLAFNGKMCPGLAKSNGLVSFLIKACMVSALSAAEIPVVTPFPRRSTETVNPVSIGSVLFSTIMPKPNS